MTDYLSWFYIAILAIPALTIIFATYKSAHRWRTERLLTNMIELSAFFTIPLFYSFAALVGLTTGLLFGDHAAIGFIVGFCSALLAGEVWLIMKLKPLFSA
jgi:hypothetical protein